MGGEGRGRTRILPPDYIAKIPADEGVDRLSVKRLRQSGHQVLSSSWNQGFLRGPGLREFADSGGHSISYLAFHHAFLGLCQRAGVEDLTPHDLRHTFASRLAQSGVPLAAIKTLLGPPHDPHDRGGYVHFADEQEAVDRLVAAKPIQKGDAMGERAGGEWAESAVEAALGFEPRYRGFADLRLTTWLRRLFLWPKL